MRDTLRSHGGDPTGIPSVLEALARSQPWAKDAACRDSPLQWVLDTNHEKRQPATIFDRMLVCETCPVRLECLRDALGSGYDVYGIWGGTTQGERRRYRRRTLKRGDGEIALTDYDPDAAEQLEASFPLRFARWKARADAHKAEMARRGCTRRRQGSSEKRERKRQA